MTLPWAALPGARLIGASVGGTVLFALVSGVAVGVGGGALWPAFVVALGLFAAGVAVFVAAYARAVARSGTDEIGIGGLFFLAGPTAPAATRAWLLGAFAAQCVVAVAAAAARPFSTLAFGVLAPVYGLALCGRWAARHGAFAPRAPRPSVVRDRARRPPDTTVARPDVGKNADHG